MSPPLVLIAALGRNGAIGAAGGLPWRIPSDLRRFKRMTMGKPLVLGRKTFDSIGRPLPGRHVVVVTRHAQRAWPAGVVAEASIPAALERARGLAALHGAEAVMVGGGAELYRATIGEADRLVLTEVALAPEGDAFFPSIDQAIWREVSRESLPREAGDQADAVLVHYLRRS